MNIAGVGMYGIVCILLFAGSINSQHVHDDIKANCFVLEDIHSLHITHQGGTFPLHHFGPHGGERKMECCATLEAPPGVVSSGVTTRSHYAIILDDPFKLPVK